MTDSYDVDIDSIKLAFPVAHKAEALVVEFCEWLSDVPQNSVGNFEIKGNLIDDFLCINGADLAESFGLFISLPDGGKIGVWICDESAKSYESPIVLIGSEGERRIISNTLPGFIKALSESKTGIELLDEEDDSNANYRKKLNDWIVSKDVPVTKKEIKDLERWLNNWEETEKVATNNNENIKKIKELLSPYVKPNDILPSSFEIFITGKKFEIWRKGVLFKKVKESKSIEPLIRELRIDRAKRMPERGFWFTAWLEVFSDGELSIACDFFEFPKFKNTKPTRSDFEDDFSAFNKSQKWIPKWFEE